MPNDQITNLIKQYNSGDSAAFDAIYTATSDDFYRYARKITSDEAAIEDALQETYIKIASSLQTLEDPSKFSSWGRTILRNKLTDSFRKSKHDVLMPTMSDDEGSETDFFDSIENQDMYSVPGEELERREVESIIRDALDHLSVVQRQTIIYYYYDEMSISDIALLMDCSEGTVKSRLNSGREKLRLAVAGFEETNGFRIHAFLPFFIIHSALISEDIGMGLPFVASGNILAGAKKSMRIKLKPHSPKNIAGKVLAGSAGKTAVIAAATLSLSLTAYALLDTFVFDKVKTDDTSNEVVTTAESVQSQSPCDSTAKVKASVSDSSISVSAKEASQTKPEVHKTPKADEKPASAATASEPGSSESNVADKPVTAPGTPDISAPVIPENPSEHDSNNGFDASVNPEEPNNTEEPNNNEEPIPDSPSVFSNTSSMARSATNSGHGVPIVRNGSDIYIAGFPYNFDISLLSGGIIADINSLTAGKIEEMCFDSGFLYYISNDVVGGQLYRFNPATGESELMADKLLSDLSGLIVTGKKAYYLSEDAFGKQEYCLDLTSMNETFFDATPSITTATNISDGRYIYYISKGNLYRVPESGGSADTLCDASGASMLLAGGDSLYYLTGNNYAVGDQPITLVKVSHDGHSKSTVLDIKARAVDLYISDSDIFYMEHHAEGEGKIKRTIIKTVAGSTVFDAFIDLSEAGIDMNAIISLNSHIIGGDGENLYISINASTTYEDYKLLYSIDTASYAPHYHGKFII